MKTYAPDYYKDFRCIASECRHNCCIGWEIDIDDETYEYYKSVKGDFGEKLRKSIACGECNHFILGEDERCPFLNSENLCDIITTLGEESLCQICSDHPRYRNFLSDREETGIGLACEAAAKLIVTKKDKTVIAETADDGVSAQLFCEDAEFLEKRNEIFSILQNRQKSIDDRLSEMLSFCGASLRPKTAAEYAEILLELEYMEDEWLDALRKLEKSAPDIGGLAEFETAFEQIAVYFTYRYLTDSVVYGDLGKRAAFCVFCTNAIRFLCALKKEQTSLLTYDAIAEAARMFSAETEYSEENIRLLSDMLTQ